MTDTGGGDGCGGDSGDGSGSGGCGIYCGDGVSRYSIVLVVLKLIIEYGGDN